MCNSIKRRYERSNVKKLRETERKIINIWSAVNALRIRFISFSLSMTLGCYGQYWRMQFDCVQIVFIKTKTEVQNLFGQSGLICFVYHRLHYKCNSFVIFDFGCKWFAPEEEERQQHEPKTTTTPTEKSTNKREMF